VLMLLFALYLLWMHSIPTFSFTLFFFLLFHYLLMACTRDYFKVISTIDSHHKSVLHPWFTLPTTSLVELKVEPRHMTSCPHRKKTSKERCLNRTQKNQLLCTKIHRWKRPKLGRICVGLTSHTTRMETSIHSWISFCSNFFYFW
jgi:hypothetical protein